MENKLKLIVPENFEEFGKLIEDQIKNKVDSIIVCGTTGEASTMTLEEKQKIY